MKNEEDLLALHEFIMEHIDSRLHDDEFDKLYWLLDRVQNHISDDDFKILYDDCCELIQLREKSYDYRHDSNESNNCYFEIEELFKKFYNKFYISIIYSITKK